MKIYTKHQVKNSDGELTGITSWYMYDVKTGNCLAIRNFDAFCGNLPYSISGTAIEVCVSTDCIIIDEMEFHEVYDKALDSLQNYIP